MAALTGRYTAKEDVTAFKVAGTDVLATFRSGTLEITCDEIDVTALKDAWKKREFGTLDWRVTCSHLISASPAFVAACVAGGVIVISINTTGGFAFLGTGMITGAPLNLDNPVTEDITVVSAGASPTFS